MTTQPIPAAPPGSMLCYRCGELVRAAEHGWEHDLVPGAGHPCAPAVPGGADLADECTYYRGGTYAGRTCLHDIRDGRLDIGPCEPCTRTLNELIDSVIGADR